MTKLNQIVAVEKGVKAKAARTITDGYHTVQRATGLSGIARTYRPRDEEGDALPPESTLVQTKVDDIVTEITADLGRLFDVTATKDATNAVATADVNVDGNVLVADATVPFLLFLEKQLVDIRTFVSKLPTLDPAESWAYDNNSGVYATVPTQTVRTKKIPKNWVKAEATDKHPAQVEIFHEDVIVGTWTTIKFSGAVPSMRVNELLTRVDRLVEAVKFAREEANGTTVVDRSVGSAIFGYIFA